MIATTFRFLTPQLFRRHVRHRAAHVIVFRECFRYGRRVFRLSPLRQAEIKNLEASVSRQPQIASLQITMDDALEWAASSPSASCAPNRSTSFSGKGPAANFVSSPTLATIPSPGSRFHPAARTRTLRQHSGGSVLPGRELPAGNGGANYHL